MAKKEQATADTDPDTITTPSGRIVGIDSKQMHKMRNLSALESSDVDRMLGAVERTVTSLSADEIGELSDVEFIDLVKGLRLSYQLPKGI